MDMKSASTYSHQTAEQASDTRLNDIARQVSQLSTYFIENGTRLRNFTDRTLGTEVTKEAQTSPRPVPNGSLDEITMGLADLHEVASVQAGLINRLERIG